MADGRYVVAQLGARLHYNVAVALNSVQRLEKLVTDFYTPDWVLRLPTRFQGPLRRRHNRLIPSHRADGTSLRSLIPIVRNGRDRPYYGRADFALGGAAFDRVVAAGCGVVIFGLYWPGFVAQMRQDGWSCGPRIVLVDHPIPSHVRSVVSAYRALHADHHWPEVDEELLPVGEAESFDSVLSAADGYVVPCTFVREGLLAAGVPPEKVTILPLGSDRTPNTAVVRTRRGRPHSGLRVLWVGTPSLRKGFRTMLEACRLVGRNAVELTVVVPPSAAKTLRADTIHPTTVKTRLSVEELDNEYSYHDLLVMPSTYEGFGMVYLEALRNGLPVVYTRNTGIADLIKDREAGFLVEPGDPEQLAAKLVDALSNPMLLESMSERGAEVGEKWTWTRFRKGLLRAIAELEPMAR